MLCEECNERNAEVLITEVDAKGNLKEKHLCKQCAKKKGYIHSKEKPIAELFADYLKESATKDDSELKCVSCGSTWEDFRKIGRFGCQECYRSFGVKIENLLSRIHGTTRHVGRKIELGLSNTLMFKEMELKRLRKALAQAIQAEDYERAAKIRDSLRKFEGN